MLHYRTCDWEEEIAVLVGDAFAFKRETLTCTHLGRYEYRAPTHLNARHVPPPRPV